MRRLLARVAAAPALAVALALAGLPGAAPAWAHQEIGPASVAVGKPVFFTLSAANEKRVDLTRVTVTAPAGSELGHAATEPPGWTVNLTHEAATWTGGTVKPGRFDSWGFEFEGADQPGVVTWRVTFGFADGTTQSADVPVTVVADAGGGTPSQSTATTATAPITLPVTNQDTEASAPNRDGDSDESSDLAVPALGVSVLALVASVVALARARRGPAAPLTGREQDW